MAKSNIDPKKFDGILNQSIVKGRVVVINNDAEVDDGRAIVEILKAASYFAKQANKTVDVAISVGDGDPAIRLKIIRELINKLAQDGLTKNLDISYFKGIGTQEPKNAVYENLMKGKFPENNEEFSDGVDELYKWMSTKKDQGMFIYGLKNTFELKHCYDNDPSIFNNSHLQTYFGGYNYKTYHGVENILNLLGSFESANGFGNFTALRGGDNSKPQSKILESTTPKVAKLMHESDAKYISFLKEMTLAWNAQMVYWLIEDFESDAQKILDTDKKYEPFLDNLKNIFAEIKTSKGIDYQKITESFMRGLAPDLEQLPSKGYFMVEVCTQIAKEPDLQSVVADDLPALHSIDSRTVQLFTEGKAAFSEGGYMEVKPVNGGKCANAEQMFNFEIGEFDEFAAHILGPDFPPAEDALMGNVEDFGN